MKWESYEKTAQIRTLNDKLIFQNSTKTPRKNIYFSLAFDWSKAEMEKFMSEPYELWKTQNIIFWSKIEYCEKTGFQQTNARLMNFFFFSIFWLFLHFFTKLQIDVRSFNSTRDTWWKRKNRPLESIHFLDLKNFIIYFEKLWKLWKGKTFQWSERTQVF